MKKLALAIALVLAVATLALAAPKGKKYKEHTIHGFQYDKHAVERLLDDSEVPGEVKAYAWGVREVKGKFKLDMSKPVEDAALDFIDRHRSAFRLKNPKKELKKDYSEGLSYQQIYNGVPVWGHSLSVHLDQDFDVTLIMSNLIPTPDIDTTPLVTEEEVVEIVKADLDKVAGGEAEFSKSAAVRVNLFIYSDKLAYRVMISAYRPHGAWQYFVDARKGTIINKEDQIRY